MEIINISFSNTIDRKLKSAEKIRIFSAEGSYKLVPVERHMSTRYVTQMVSEKHRVRLSPRHSLLEYNQELGTERVLEEHEKVCEVNKLKIENFMENDFS